MKSLLRTGIIVLALFITSLATPAQTTVADFSGTWVFKSGKNDQHLASMQINQSGPQIEVTEKYEPKQKRSNRILTYYSDARGESNESFDGKYQLKSRTKWMDRLFTQFESLTKITDSTDRVAYQGSYKRYDEWTLSKNGETLTITTTF